MHLFLRKLLKTALILVALLIVAGFVTQACVQSQWYRAKLERRLGEALEMDVKIASIAMEWPCSAVLTDVQGKASGSSAEIKVKEIRGTFLSSALSIVQPIVRLSKGVGGDWQPAPLGGLARALDADKPIPDIVGPVLYAFGRRIHKVSSATIMVKDGAAESPVFGGLTIDAEPLRLSGYSAAYHYHAVVQTRCGTPATEDGPEVTDWIAKRGARPIALWPDSSALVPLPTSTPEPEAAETDSSTAEEPATPAAEDAADDAKPSEAPAEDTKPAESATKDSKPAEAPADASAGA